MITQSESRTSRAWARTEPCAVQVCSAGARLAGFAFREAAHAVPCWQKLHCSIAGNNKQRTFDTLQWETSFVCTFFIQPPPPPPSIVPGTVIPNCRCRDSDNSLQNEMRSSSDISLNYSHPNSNSPLKNDISFRTSQVWSFFRIWCTSSQKHNYK